MILDYESVIGQVNEMLDEIILGLKRYAANHLVIKALIEGAERAKKLLDLEKRRMAVLGQQAAGKSSLLSALLARALLEICGGRKSATAFPVVIIHKQGATDDTKLSDIITEWVEKDQWRAHVSEYSKRWGDVHPGSQDEGSEEVEEESSDNDEDSDLEPEEVVPDIPKPRKTPERQLGASTAKEFFQLIFNVEEDKAAKKILEHRLYNTDIRQGDFQDLCIEKLSARFQQLNQQLQIKNNVSEWFDVHDEDLGMQRKLAKKLWPFVKAFTIATGHIIPRYGMCLYDLPGNVKCCARNSLY